MPEKFKPTPEELGIKENLAENEKSFDVVELNTETSIEVSKKDKKPIGYWTDVSEEELIKEIESRGLDPKNLPSTSILNEVNSSLVGGLNKRYGSLTKARKALGGKVIKLEPGYWKNMSEEELIDEMKSRGLDPKNLPSQAEMNVHNGDLLGGLTKRYGTVNKARLALGSEIIQRARGYWNNLSEEGMIQEIKSRGLDPKDLPKTSILEENYSDLLSGLIIRFGKLNDAREALGGRIINKAPGYWKNMSEEDLIADIKARGLDTKNLPLWPELAKDHPDLAYGLSSKFGGMTNAREKLGGILKIKPKGYWQNISLEDLVQEIQSRGLDPKDLPSGDTLRNDNPDLMGGLQSRFGSFNRAREALGSEITQRSQGYWKNLSEEDLITYIKSRGLDPKNLPTYLDLKNHKGLLQGLQKRFGSLQEARIKLGGEPLLWLPGHWRNISIEDLKAHIKKKGFDPENLPSNLAKENPALTHILRTRFGDMASARIELGGEKVKRPRGYWKNLSIENLIQEIESRGLDPKNLPGTHELDSDLAVGLAQRYGSFTEARTAVGGEVLKRRGGYWKSINEEKLKLEILERGLDPHNLPSYKILRDTHSDLVAGLTQRYGSFPRAREMLGGRKLKNEAGYWNNISEEELEKEIRGRGLDPKNLPATEEFQIKHSGLLAGLRQRFGTLNEAREALGGVVSATYSKNRVDRIMGHLQEKVVEVAKGETVEAKEIQDLINIFGNANCLDILYKFHPEYHKLPTGRVKSILADYLGEFLSSSIPLNLESIPNRGLELLENHTFQDSLIEIIKNDALSSFNKKKKTDFSASPQLIMTEYLDNLRNIGIKYNNTDLSSVIQTVESYYDSLYELSKPENIVDFVDQGRRFPEFYQQINIKEIADKKKILLADEMGVGKSASAILAKEYMNVRQALIVAPNNVIETWRNYLLDKIGEDGKQIGYFKEGNAPKVLIVNNLNSLEDKDRNDYEYILISQEKLNKKYTQKLSSLDYEMLIVDEVHKLKNISSGIRSTHLLDLASKIEGKDKYLALLSGTPIPNKVEDIAITLKLLYPEEFEHMPNKTLVKRIIHSDSIDLRTKLLPRMEMKKLAESVEMPSLEENIISPELSEIEQSIYEMLLEEDEIESTEKIRILRQFLLNPELLDATPNIESSKRTAVGESLRKTFEEKDKVVMFVNGYISNVIKGEKNIIHQLNLPLDVDVRVIHGNISITERAAIQKELKDSENKILLLVSGQTADVGVDFSGGQSVYFYNEPWTRYEQKQELGRVYRPGLSEDLESKTFITKNTIEEGIHLYIQAKEQAIEKLLRGLPRSEIENRLLDESEKQTDPNLEVNPELARYYFSDWDKMAKIFAHIKEIGQENFMQFLADFGKDYASCYLNLGSRSYHANANRVSGTIIDELAKKSQQNPEDLLILDIASGPEMLKKHIPTQYQSKITSMDVNKEHFKGEGDDRVVGSFQKLPFADRSVDYANFALALHYTQFIPSRNNYERLETLLELNRVLKIGGKAVLNMIYSIDFKDGNKLRNSLEAIGLKIKDEYSGEVQVGKNYKSKILTLEKTEHLNESLEDMVDKIGKDDLDGLKFVGNKSSVRDTRKIIEQFELGGKQFKIDFNEEDKQVLAEEQEITRQGETLKLQYGSIQDINKEDIISNGFTRILIKDKYILFKKLEKGTGVVVIK